MTFNKAFFNKQDKIGQIGEAAFKELMSTLPQFSAVNKVDFNTHHYDFETISAQTGKTKTWEIKTVKKVSTPWRKFTAETETFDLSCGYRKVPEYITHKDEIDYIVYYDDTRRALYFYDNKVFATWVEDNADQAFNNQYSTAKVVQFKPEDKEVGFLYKYNLPPTGGNNNIFLEKMVDAL